MLALLSVFRYVNIIHKNSSFSRWMENHRTSSVLICAIVSLAWSVPPLFNWGNAYTSEHIGFHCSLDWNSSAFHSRFFVYSLLICNYFLILFMLIYSNLRVYFVLRHLLKANKQLSASLIPPILHLSIANINCAACLIVNSNVQPESRKRLSDRQIRGKLNRLERWKVDRRYARITAIMVTQFVIAWTPYAILATVIITGHMDWARQYPILATVSELFAKFSLILNPLILIFTSRMRQ
jgi:7 transmembrane receptor (rhodopsin family)